MLRGAICGPFMNHWAYIRSLLVSKLEPSGENENNGKIIIICTQHGAFSKTFFSCVIKRKWSLQNMIYGPFTFSKENYNDE